MSFKIVPAVKIIKYSLDGGKCIRPFIIKHLMQKLSGNTIDVWQIPVVIELIHSASLIIDDLPCMDNDIVRRNKPSTFIKFGEAEAIMCSLYLSSDALKLLLEGYRSLQNDNDKKTFDSFDSLYTLCIEFVELCGKNIIVGQLLDLNKDIKKLLNFNIPNMTHEEIIIIYKTCSLFMLCFILGGVFGGVSIDNIEDYKQMGIHFGFMFQIQDDYEDLEKDINTESWKVSNIVYIRGEKKVYELYIHHKNCFISLLKKHNIYTEEFIKLIGLIDIKVNTFNK